MHDEDEDWLGALPHSDGELNPVGHIEDTPADVEHIPADGQDMGKCWEDELCEDSDSDTPNDEWADGVPASAPKAAPKAHAAIERGA